MHPPLTSIHVATPSQVSSRDATSHPRTDDAWATLLRVADALIGFGFVAVLAVAALVGAGL